MNKREMKESVKLRRQRAESILNPQWSRCFWTRPFGHVHDGSTAHDVVGRGEYAEVCLYCGKPTYVSGVKGLERHAQLVGLYPIARRVSKLEVAA